MRSILNVSSWKCWNFSIISRKYSNKIKLIHCFNRYTYFSEQNIQYVCFIIIIKFIDMFYVYLWEQIFVGV